MAMIHQSIQHNSGIPLGGVGTGTVEVRPDGLFHEWEIMNTGQWSPASPGSDQGRNAMAPEDLVFMVRTRTPDGRIVARYLALREQLHDLYCLAWARSVESIYFEGTFPLARLTYRDKALPVAVQAELFSPFVPLDSRASGTPGFYVHFTVANLTDTPVDVSILGMMKNPAAWAQENRKPRNKLITASSPQPSPHRAQGANAPSALGAEGRSILLTADDMIPGHFSTGDVTFSAVGGEVSYLTGCFAEDRRAMTFWRSRFGLKMMSLLHQFHDDGRLPNLKAERPPQPRPGFQASRLSDSERRALLDELLQYPAFHDKYHRIGLADPALVRSPEFLDELMDNVAYLVERKAQWGHTALCSKHDVARGAEAEALFAVTWHFPNHISPTGENIGHQYEHWFADSTQVADFMLSNFSDLRARTLALPEAIHGSSLPPEVADAVTSQLSTLTKDTWWTRSGHFGVWEGHGCCGFHTTDITYQGSFPIISLLPDLQKAQMEHGARFQRDDGRVHHFFTPDFSAVDNGFDRVDMNQQFVMLAARDYLWSGDRAYLERLWPHIIRAMDNTALLDTDGDGLPDSDTRRNTYDAWDFTGCPSYIASLWLGALKAAVRLANEMGDSARAAAWQQTYKRGLASFESKLWNGEYYVLWRDGDAVDECCMSDQMSGDWFAAACGWGPILAPERIKQALRAIVTYNFRPGGGLLNASYPEGKQRRLAASGNYQADAPWTGIEYTVAALLIANGMAPEAMAIVRDIHERYMQAGRVWNHVECGGHYYRAMSSWTMLIALSGFAWDQPTGILTFAPVHLEPVERHAGQTIRYPFFTSGAWGRFEQDVSGKSVRIEVLSGELGLRKLALPEARGFEKAVVTIDGSPVRCSIVACGDGVCVEFEREVKVGKEASLVRDLQSGTNGKGAAAAVSA